MEVHKYGWKNYFSECLNNYKIVKSQTQDKCPTAEEKCGLSPQGNIQWTPEMIVYNISVTGQGSWGHLKNRYTFT